jgi:antitoxin component of RelBE/YafQ-DinJ toxin-antitoxin module
MPRKIVSINLDETTHLEAKRLAKKKGLSFSRLTEELLEKFVREEWKKEEMQRTVEQKKLEEADKGEKLSREFMKKLLYDENYRSEEWVMVGY